jgi:hypothetical protein
VGVEDEAGTADALSVELEALLVAARRNVRDLRELLTVVSRHLDAASLHARDR